MAEIHFSPKRGKERFHNKSWVRPGYDTKSPKSSWKKRKRSPEYGSDDSSHEDDSDGQTHTQRRSLLARLDLSDSQTTTETKSLAERVARMEPMEEETNKILLDHLGIVVEDERASLESRLSQPLAPRNHESTPFVKEANWGTKNKPHTFKESHTNFKRQLSNGHDAVAGKNALQVADQLNINKEGDSNPPPPTTSPPATSERRPTENERDPSDTIEEQSMLHRNTPQPGSSASALTNLPTPPVPPSEASILSEGEVGGSTAMLSSAEEGEVRSASEKVRDIVTPLLQQNAACRALNPPRKSLTVDTSVLSHGDLVGFAEKSHVAAQSIDQDQRIRAVNLPPKPAAIIARAGSSGSADPPGVTSRRTSLVAEPMSNPSQLRPGIRDPHGASLRYTPELQESQAGLYEQTYGRPTQPITHSTIDPQDQHHPRSRTPPPPHHRSASRESRTRRVSEQYPYVPRERTPPRSPPHRPRPTRARTPPRPRISLSPVRRYRSPPPSAGPSHTQARRTSGGDAHYPQRRDTLPPHSPVFSSNTFQRAHWDREEAAPRERGRPRVDSRIMGPQRRSASPIPPGGYKPHGPGDRLRSYTPHRHTEHSPRAAQRRDSRGQRRTESPEQTLQKSLATSLSSRGSMSLQGSSSAADVTAAPDNDRDTAQAVTAPRERSPVGTTGINSSARDKINPPLFWAAKRGLNHLGILKWTVNVDQDTAKYLGLRPRSGIQTSDTAVGIQKQKIVSLKLACFPEKHASQCIKVLESGTELSSVTSPTAPQWPDMGKLIIKINEDMPGTRGKTWFPDKLGPEDRVISVENFIYEGENQIDMIQLGGMEDKVFLLFARKLPPKETDVVTFPPLANSLAITGPVTIKPAIVTSGPLY